MSAEALVKIEKGLSTIEEQNATIMKNYEQWSAENKKTLEELTLLKNAQADQAVILRQVQKLNKAVSNERKMAFGDPFAAIARDTDKAAMIMAGIAKALDILDKCGKTIQGVAKDLDTANTPGSTYIANAEIDREIYDLLLMYGAYRNLNVRTISSKAVDVRIKTARAAFAFVDEAAAIGADSTKAGSKTTLTPKKIGCLISVSNELMDDDITGMVQDILRDFVEGFAEKVDWISFSADGTADALDGGFTGLFYGGTSRVAASGNVSVATLDYDDWLACLINAPASVLERPTTNWFLHPTMLARSMTLKDTTGRPIFQTAMEAPALGTIGSILGFPVKLVGNAPSTDGTSKKIAAFGDSEGQAVRIKKDLTVDKSDQYAFNTDEITFRATGRVASLTRAATAFQVLTTAAS